MSDKRSPEAKRRRAPARNRAIRSGTRVSCDICKVLHPAPACAFDAEPVTIPVTLPPWLHARLAARVVKGERSRWVVSLIRRELGV